MFENKLRNIYKLVLFMKYMNKKRSVALLFLLVSVLLVVGVFAQGFTSGADLGGGADIGGQLNRAINAVVEAVKPVLESILGPTDNGTMLFAKLLFFLILVSIIWAAVSQIDALMEYEWIAWVITIGTSILGVKYFTTGIIQTIILPYTALGIAISAGLPFVLYFFIVNMMVFKGAKFKTMRRIAWIFFGVIFIGLWITRAGQIPGRSDLIYPITAIAALVMIVLDGTIQRFFVQLRIDRAGANKLEDAELKIREKIAKTEDLFADGIITAAERDKRKKRLQRQLAHLYK